MKRTAPWYYKHVALTLAKEQGFRPVVFNVAGKMVTAYVRPDDEDWSRHATLRGASEVICGVTATLLWSDNARAA